ncbi:MAG: hypothetical protein JSS69_08315 [Acidobacteria bacterium]|nr:hypothetical protein [Acidobacteriota bacterium]MBS1865908.1 hypothetical protein [Acidobacteriota bacterium]
MIRAFSLIGLLSLLPVNQVRTLSAMRDYDIWWHTRVGHWILRTHSFPHAGIFSRTGENLPWASYSWGFELIVARLQSYFGLLSGPLFAMAMDIIIVSVLFAILWRLSRSFWWSWLLTYVAIWAMDLNWVSVARPVMFTILFFTIELGLLFLASASKRGGQTALYWLPLLFIVWANCHIQFIYGLGTLGLFAVVATAEHWVARRKPSGESSVENSALNPALLWSVFGACLLATLLNPYGFGLYRVVFHYALESKFAFNVVNELRAMSFRRDSHFVELLLVLMAFFAMGRRKLEPFKLALLLVAAIAAFRSSRDTWFLSIPAAAVIACSVNRTKVTDDEVSSEPSLGLNRLQLAAVLAGSLCIVALSGYDSHFSQDNAIKAVQTVFPLDAATYIEKNRPPGPLFNLFDWGGFLIATLPDYPVSIDGRTDVYGDDLMRTGANSGNGLNFDQDPAFNQANLFLLPVYSPLCRVLERSPQFRLVYADKIALVFVRTR